MARLDEYRGKRDPARTKEPMPLAEETGAGNSFVIQEHHARSLHWDFRLERDGALVSWAVPKGIPPDPRVNHLAVRVEDHPLSYGSFEGAIGAGQYGAGAVTIWDRGTYQIEKWTDREVKVILHGGRVEGQFVLFQTGGKNWMIHRMGAPARPAWSPLPDHIRPMLAVAGDLPGGPGWAFEMKWNGVRALVRADGGRIALRSGSDLDITVSYPELRALGERLGSTQVLLDGEIVAFDDDGRPSFGRLQQRMHVTVAAQARTLAQRTPATLLIFDLLHLDGRSLLDQTYLERRKRLEQLGLAGPNWQTPPAFDGSGAQAVETSRAQQLEGVLAKRVTSRYLPGRRSPDWVKVKNVRHHEVVIGGWRPGQGRRADTIGSLLLGLPSEDGLRYVGQVRTGFTRDALDTLLTRLTRLHRKTSPFATAVPTAQARNARWVRPALVGEVTFTEWTADGRLRHPSWRRLRPDKSPDEVRLED